MTVYVIGGIAAIALVAAVSIRQFLAPPSTAPDYDEPRPALALADDGYVTNTESIMIDLPREDVHSWVSNPELELEDFVDSGDDFPEIVGTDDIVGDFSDIGNRQDARRVVNFADGHFLAEEVISDSEENFRYMIWGFTSYQRLAVDHGVAEFKFIDHGDRSEIKWIYSLQPRNAIVRPAVNSFVEGALQTMMVDTLAGMKEGAESELLE